MRLSDVQRGTESRFGRNRARVDGDVARRTRLQRAATRSAQLRLRQAEPRLEVPVGEQGFVQLIAHIAEGFPDQFGHLGHRELSGDTEGALDAPREFIVEGNGQLGDQTRV